MTNYYVSTSGNDSYNGLYATYAGGSNGPWLTIQHAADTVTAGHTVYMLNGVYTPNYKVTFDTNNGSVGNRITFTSFPSHKVVVNGKNIAHESFWQGVLDIYTDYLTINNLSVVSGYKFGISSHGANQVEIYNNYLYDHDGSGIWVGDSSTNVTISGNEVFYCCTGVPPYTAEDDIPAQEGISLVGVDGFQVAYNYIHDFPKTYEGSYAKEGIDCKVDCKNGSVHHNRVGTTAWGITNNLAMRQGIYIDGWDGLTYNIDVYSNYCFNCQQSLFPINAERGGTVSGVIIYNNIGYNTTLDGHGCYLNIGGSTSSGWYYATMHDISVINNTFVGNIGNGIKAYDTSNTWKRIKIKNNILYDNDLRDLYLLKSGGAEISLPTDRPTWEVRNNLVQDGAYQGSTYNQNGSPSFIDYPPTAPWETLDTNVYTLASGSNCINAATTTDAPSTDYFGYGRPFGLYDIGAIEYGTASGFDSIAPYVNGQNPSNSQTNVSKTSSIVAHIKDDSSGVSSGTIVMTVEGESVLPSITGTKFDYTATYIKAGPWDYNQVVNVTLSGADISGNRMVSPESWSFTVESAPVVGASGWLGTWAKRVEVSIDADDIDADLVNFPVALILNTTAGYGADDVSFIFDEVGDSSKKIAITTSGGTEQCYVEIEKWDDAAELAILHVKVPSVANSYDTKLYLYFDSAQSDNTTYVGDTNSTPAKIVWSGNNYNFVTHMNDATTSTIYDSSPYSIHGNKVSVNHPVERLKGIQTVQYFDGTSDYINHGTTFDIGTNDFTVEVYCSCSGTIEANQVVLSKYTSQVTGFWLPYHISTNDWTTHVAYAGSYTDSNNSTALNFEDGSLHYASFIIDRSANVTYRFDGAAYGSGGVSAGVGWDITSTGYLMLGAGRTGTEYRWDGDIAEVRISVGSLRSVAWCDATYETLRDHLVLWGSEEYIPSGVVTYEISKINDVDLSSIYKINSVPLSSIEFINGISLLPPPPVYYVSLQGVIIPSGTVVATENSMLLSVSETNPRYFENENGDIVYLTGSHTWSNLVDATAGTTTSAFDWDGYMNFLVDRGHNFIRLWTWEASGYASGNQYHSSITPYERTGPGTADDGLLKFDLDTPSGLYFTRLAERVSDAKNNGIYVDIMLFEGYEILNWGSSAVCNPYEGNNNIDAIDGGNAYTMYTTASGATATLKQKQYVERVIDAVYSYDNVLYEIGNEMTGVSGGTSWQYNMINHIKSYELSTYGVNHPVGMTYQSIWYPDSTNRNSNLYASNADWVSINASVDTVPVASAYAWGKVSIFDTDHPVGINDGVAMGNWVWKSACQGHNPIYMDAYGQLGYGGNPYNESDPDNDWLESARTNMGYAREYMDELPLKHMVPSGVLSNQGYCLAQPASAYLAWSVGTTITLTMASGTYSTVKWRNIDTGTEIISGALITTGGSVNLYPPATFSGADCVVMLKI